MEPTEPPKKENRVRVEAPPPNDSAAPPEGQMRLPMGYVVLLSLGCLFALTGLTLAYLAFAK